MGSKERIKVVTSVNGKPIAGIKVPIEITQEMIEKKTAELCDMIKNFNGSKSDAAAHVCFEAANWGSCNHFEALGILTEVIFMYRNISINTMNEEDEEKE